jgi:hypothetical protein
MTRLFSSRGADQYLSGFFRLSAQTPRKDEGTGATRADPNLSALAWRQERTALRYAMSGVLNLLLVIGALHQPPVDCTPVSATFVFRIYNIVPGRSRGHAGQRVGGEGLCHARCLGPGVTAAGCAEHAVGGGVRLTSERRWAARAAPPAAKLGLAYGCGQDQNCASARRHEGLWPGARGPGLQFRFSATRNPLVGHAGAKPQIGRCVVAPLLRWVGMVEEIFTNRQKKSEGRS